MSCKQITFKTLDGEVVVANYNYGPWLQSRKVVIGPFENGKIAVDGVEYKSTYFETLTDGTTITVLATPDEGSTFVKWSDDIQDTTRTITINGSDVSIYPIFESDYILFDSGNIVDFDNLEHIVYK